MLSLAVALAALTTAPVSTEIVLPSQPAPLHGTLLTPPGASAVAVILPGSGPTDRDGNSPMGVAAGTYRMLAEGLADQGIATLRIDKRGIAASAAAGPAEADLRFDAYAADARAWAAEAAARAGKPCAWLIGHSEGALVALVALKAVAGGDDKVCGLVLLSGAGRPAGVVLREQLTALPDPLKTQAYDALTELEAGRTVAEPPAALAAADPDATLKLWDGVNHVLKTAPADRAGNLATYADPDLPLAPGVTQDVAAFIRTNAAR